MMAWLLVPAEWVAQRLGLHPLDVRLHHLSAVVMHFFYLMGVWHLLRKFYAGALSCALSFVAAIPTVVYFSYAPFVSHDILPGLGLLYLLWLSNEFQIRPSKLAWLQFLCVTLVLVLIKQTYCIIPICLVVARWIVVLTQRTSIKVESRRLLALSLAALLAGMLSWLVYASVVGDSFAGEVFLMRPWSVIQQIATGYGPNIQVSDLFYSWVYLRNAAAYGIVAMTLVLLSLGFSLWRGGSLHRQAALCWILLVVAIQCTPFKEVRYLAFLAPLTAFLIVPLVRHVLSGPRPYLWLLISVMIFDTARASHEAMRINDPYYRTGITDFFKPLDSIADAKFPKFFGIGWLNFVSADRDAFFGDNFHRITEVQIDQLRALYGWEPNSVFRIRLQSVSSAIASSPGAIFFIQNLMLSRGPPYRSGNLPGLSNNFVQILGRVETAEFLRIGDDYRVLDRPGVPMAIIDAAGTITVRHGSIEEDLAHRNFAIEGAPERLSLQILRVLSLCDLNGCKAFKD